jgi:medium-chain acyl-[acyl-carrier-protein] hydrolase
MSTGTAPRGAAVEVRPNYRARVRLFCFPYAGGGGGVFRTWTRTMPPEIDLCPVHLPGRERRFQEPGHTKMEPLVEELHDALRPHFDIPVAFFGHSMGASIAFELARRVEAEGSRLAHLIVSGRRAPDRPRDGEEIHTLPHDAFVKKLREMEGTPDEILRDDAMLELVLPVLRADFALCANYTFAERPPLTTPISAMGGLQDADVSRDDILAWKRHTRGAFRARFFPGGHFFLHSAQSDLLREVTVDLLRSVGTV